MLVSDTYHGKNFKAEDLAGRARKLTIESYEKVTFDNGDKIVLHFEDEDQGLVLNKVNAEAIRDNLNEDDIDKWVGKDITIELAIV